MSDVLARPIWTALSTLQRSVAVGGDRARRFQDDVSPLAASRDDDPASLGELAALAGDDAILLLQADPVAMPPGLEPVIEGRGVQMVLDELHPPAADEMAIEVLDDIDAEAMLRLATATRPGPFLRRTGTLGTFLGIREAGELVAMAGRRLAVPGFAEVSGVCTAPPARGRGYAAALSCAVARQILDDGATPFLHAYADNRGAIELYERLGFRVHRPMHVALLRRHSRTT